MKLDKTQYLDVREDCKARLVNHCCGPNCRAGCTQYLWQLQCGHIWSRSWRRRRRRVDVCLRFSGLQRPARAVLLRCSLFRGSLSERQYPAQPKRKNKLCVSRAIDVRVERTQAAVRSTGLAYRAEVIVGLSVWQASVTTAGQKKYREDASVAHWRGSLSPA